MRLRICVAVLIAGLGALTIGSASSAPTASSALTGGDAIPAARDEDFREPFCSIPIGVRNRGAGLFNNETFGGNGRTCATCHPDGAFTLSPEAVQARFTANPQDPLFLQDGSDDGMDPENGTTRIRSEATIRITRKLPPYMSIAQCGTGIGCDPCATIATETGSLVCDPKTVVLPRAVPTLLNIGVESVLPRPQDSFPDDAKPARLLVAAPLIEGTFMLDGRNPNLQDQALEAVQSHFEPKLLPNQGQLDKIATFQTTAEFFTSSELADVACGGPDPGLPQGTTPEQIRGREFFVPMQQGTKKPDGKLHFDCSSCHAGPLLNEVRFNPAGATVIPDGTRFNDNLVSTIRARPDQLIDFTISDIDGVKRTLTTGDPGRLLIPKCDGTPGCVDGNFRCRDPLARPPFDVPCTTNIAGFISCGACLLCSNFVPFNPALAGRENNICGLLPGQRGNATKTPSLRGISRTAPFFHDHSAADLEAVVRHYVDFFEFHFRRTCTKATSEGVCTEARLDGRLSEQDVLDIVAFMELL